MVEGCFINIGYAYAYLNQNYFAGVFSANTDEQNS